MSLQHDDLHPLREGASEYGISLSEEQLRLFRVYLNELVLWNRHVNLTGVSTRERMVMELFLDSLIPAPHLPEEGRVLDVGSGAGFPGLPLKIYRPKLDLHLLEPKSKRVSFLKHIIRLLGLGRIEILKGRIEEGGENLHPDGYPVITARAVAPLFQTLAWCEPFLSPLGLLVCFLGSGVQQALDKSRQIMEAQGIHLHKKIPYALPGKKSERNVLIFRKNAPMSGGPPLCS